MKKVTIEFKMAQVVKRLPSSGYKMGDKFTLIVGELKSIHDTREYYSGRGAKYNSSIKHGDILVNMTEKELDKAFKPIAAELRQSKKNEIAYTKYLKQCKNPDFIEQKAAEAVNVIGRPRMNEEKFKKFSEEKLAQGWKKEDLEFYKGPDEGYRGCGVYRVGWKNGKMTCTIYGGFHNSKPNGIQENAWTNAVFAEMKKHSDHIVKMDGSCTEFYFRHQEDADLVTMASTSWHVPSYRGGMHLNITAVDCELVGPKLLNA